MWTDGRLKTMELDYCSDQCKQNIHSFVKTYNRFAPKFMLVAFVFALLLMAIPLSLKIITGNPFFTTLVPPVVLALMGVVLIIYPLGIVTRKYYDRLGIKYTTWFIRLTGILMVVTGIVLIWFN